MFDVQGWVFWASFMSDQTGMPFSTVEISSSGSNVEIPPGARVAPWGNACIAKSPEAFCWEFVVFGGSTWIIQVLVVSNHKDQPTYSK